jgi:ribosomal protein S18 acetylase RimI-like enzyme
MSLVRLFNNFTKSNSSIPDKGDYSELLSIAVSPDKQGMGVGKKLLCGLENELSAKSCSRLSLTTDYYNNEKTIYFYQELGYDIMYEFISYPNRKMYRMIKKI